MRTFIVRTMIVLAGFLLVSGGTVSALTVDEILDLCQAGYSTEDILEFIETLGLDEPLDSDALVRLKEGACDSDLALELVRAYDIDDAEEYGYVETYDEPSTRVAVYAGWGYPHYSYYDWWWDSYTPWWGVSYTWYDPWYYNWYRPYYYPSHHWAHWNYQSCWDCSRYYYGGYYGHRSYTAHDKTSRTRTRQAYRSYAANDKAGDYRTAISRTAVEKSYRTRAKIASSTSAGYRIKDATARSKAGYRVSKRSGETSRSTMRSGERKSTGSKVGTRRTTGHKTSVHRSGTKSRSSSGTSVKRRSTGSSKGGSSTKSTTTRRSGSSGKSSSTKSSSGGVSSGSSGSAKSSGTTQSGGSSTRTRRR